VENLPMADPPVFLVFIIYSDYSFTAPAVIPSMKYCWKHTNSIKIGMIEKNEPTTRSE
jgi:hypothetical protein